MDNVKDLKNTSNQETVQPQLNTVTLGDVTTQNQNDGVNINTIGGLTGVDESAENHKRQTIKISSNKLKQRRSIEDTKIVNPNDIVEKPKSKPSVNTIQDTAMNQLDQAVKRKQQEYRDFVEMATSMDEINRDRVDNGLEEVAGEINYLPTDLPVEVTKDPNLAKADETPINITPVSKSENEDDDNYMDDVEKDLEDEFEYNGGSNLNTNIDTSSVRIANNTPSAIEYIDDEDFDTELEEEIVEDNAEDDESVPFIADTIVEEIKEEKAEPEKVVETDTSAKAVNDLISRGSVSIVSKIDLNTDKESIDNTTSRDFSNIDDEDFEDVTYDSENNDEGLTDNQIDEITKKTNAEFRNEILQKIINTSNKLDTSSFTVSSKVASIKDAMKIKPQTQVKYGLFPMMYAERPFRATPLKGSEIAILAQQNNTNDAGVTMQQLKILYDHDASEFKPATVEAWSKTIPYNDLQSIYGALYMASMDEANYVPIRCTKTSCMDYHLHDAGSIMDNIKFKDDKQKELFNKILATPITADNTTSYESVINVINDQFAVGLKIPSIYTTVYELSSLNVEFRRKYSSIISLLFYIDYIYIIDQDTGSFIPVGWKTYAGNNSKTYKSKIATYAKILKEFTDKEFSVLTALISSLIVSLSEDKDLAFEVPQMKCQKCGADIAAMEITPADMVFMRQRLVEFATTSTER